MLDLWKIVIPAMVVASMGMARAGAADRMNAPHPGTDTALSGEAQILQGLKARAGAPPLLPNGIGNFASVTQSGSSNRSTVRQMGLANVSIVNQTGTANIADASILSGSWNQTAQTQKGSGNVSRLKIVNGNSNNVETQQTGESNTINLAIENADNVNILFTQNGTGLNSSQQPIVIERSGPTSSQPIEVHQSN